MSKKNGNKSLVPTDLLDDITSRFLLDAPNEILNDSIAVCFLIEQAYWFYLDEYVEDDDSLSSLKFEIFASQLLQHVKLQTDLDCIEELFKNFREFKQRVPTYGGILLNTEMTHVLLVQGFCHRASWGFPKGKINVNEEPYMCAIREVLEETGYDIGSLINPTIYLENVLGEQVVRLYIITGIPMETEFVPQTKGEIKEHRWFEINNLPSQKPHKNFTKALAYGNSNSFYMVTPFMKPLKEWINCKMHKDVLTPRQRHKSLSGNPEKINRNPSPLISDSRRRSQQGLLPTPVPIPSPKKKEGKTKVKGKHNSAEPQMDDFHQKFSFKSRGKSKIHGQPVQPPGQKVTPSTYIDSLAIPKKSQAFFTPIAWQSFKFNKKAINDVLDKLWSG